MALFAFAACKGAQHPHAPSALSQTIDLTRAGMSVRAATGDGEQTFVALSSTSPSGEPTAPGETSGGQTSASGGQTVMRATTIEARRGTTVTWTSSLGGSAAALARAGDLVVASLAASGALHIGNATLTLRGDPGAVLVGLDAATGGVRYRLPLDASDWCLVSSVAALGTDIVVGGSFAGTLRIGARVVTSAGGSDGFVARIDATGGIAWLVRMGGAGSDAIQGVATNGSDRIAIAGTFTAGADLLGEPLAAYDDRLPYADGFVAQLDASGARRWSHTFGGKGDEAVAGVTIDHGGNVVVAGSARDSVYIGGSQLDAQGDADGIVLWYRDGGEQGPSVLVGGLDFDGLRAIAAVDDRVVVGGFFAGQIRLGDRTLTAGGSDDAFIAVLDPGGTVRDAWQIGGEGREDVVALAAIRGGFVAAIAHTATANIDDDTLPAPADPLTGGALLVRGI